MVPMYQDGAREKVVNAKHKEKLVCVCVCVCVYVCVEGGNSGSHLLFLQYSSTVLHECELAVQPIIESVCTQGDQHQAPNQIGIKHQTYR